MSEALRYTSILLKPDPDYCLFRIDKEPPDFKETYHLFGGSTGGDKLVISLYRRLASELGLELTRASWLPLPEEESFWEEGGTDIILYLVEVPIKWEWFGNLNRTETTIDGKLNLRRGHQMRPFHLDESLLERSLGDIHKHMLEIYLRYKTEIDKHATPIIIPGDKPDLSDLITVGA